MNIRQNKYKNLIYLCAPLMAAAIILVVYAVRGIYPFGDGAIVDNDLLAISLPMYANYYDVFHGTASAFFDWFTAAGVERVSLSVLLSPTIYFLLCFPRDMLFDAFSFLFILKMAVVAFTSSVFLKKVFTKLPSYWVVTLALMYTFSGFNLQYYTNIDWLDTVALFPLLLLAILRMFKGKSALPFVLGMAYILLTSIYLSFFIFLFLILIGGLYVFIFMDRKDRKEAAFKLGAGSAAALIISAPVSLSSLFSIFSSSRFESVAGAEVSGGIFNTLQTALNTGTTPDYSNKILMLAGLEFSVIALILLWTKYKRDKKAPLFFTLAFLMLVAQILFENINLMWHGGSYMRFPFRNGYMLSFIMVCCIAYYCERYDRLRDNQPKLKILSYLLPALSVLSLYIIVPFGLVWANTANGIGTLDYDTTAGYATVWPFSYAFIAAFCGFILYRFIGSRKFRMGFTALLIIVIISINSYGLIGAHLEGDFSRTIYNGLSNASLRELTESDDVMNRVSRIDSSITPNYSYYIRRASLSNWTHDLGNTQRQALWDLGFSSYYTATFDMGGTAFSKALMNVRNTLSYENLPDELYASTGKDEYGCRYYDNHFVLPLGLVFDDTLDGITANGNVFEYQNQLYAALSGDTAPLFTKAEISGKKYKEQKVFADKKDQTDITDKAEENFNKKYPMIKTTTYTINVKERSVLYFKGNLGEQVIFRLPLETDSIISVNGKPYMNDMIAKYPTSANDNMLELGVFEDEKVTVGIESRYDLYETDFYVMDYARFETFCASCDAQNSYSTGNREFGITVSSDADGKYLFLPISYSDNWSGTVNGENAAVEQVLGDFIAVKLHKGENTVELKLSVYRSFIRYGAVGLLLALITAAFVIFEKKKKALPDWLLKGSLWAFAFVFAVMLALLYAIPMGYSIKNYIFYYLDR